MWDFRGGSGGVLGGGSTDFGDGRLTTVVWSSREASAGRGNRFAWVVAGNCSVSIEVGTS